MDSNIINTDESIKQIGIDVKGSTIANFKILEYNEKSCYKGRLKRQENIVS